MVYLAKANNRICPLKEISKNEGIPFDYLEKIISKLTKSGMVKAQKGVQGGYFLFKNAKKIKVGEIIRVLEGEMFLVKCFSKIKGACPREKDCAAKNFWRIIQNSLNSSLNSISLRDLINRSFAE